MLLIYWVNYMFYSYFLPDKLRFIRIWVQNYKKIFEFARAEAIFLQFLFIFSLYTRFRTISRG